MHASNDRYYTYIRLAESKLKWLFIAQSRQIELRSARNATYIIKVQTAQPVLGQPPIRK